VVIEVNKILENYERGKIIELVYALEPGVDSPKLKIQADGQPVIGIRLGITSTDLAEDFSSLLDDGAEFAPKKKNRSKKGGKERFFSQNFSGWDAHPEDDLDREIYDSHQFDIEGSRTGGSRRNLHREFEHPFSRDDRSAQPLEEQVAQLQAMLMEERVKNEKLTKQLERHQNTREIIIRLIQSKQFYKTEWLKALQDLVFYKTQYFSNRPPGVSRGFPPRESNPRRGEEEEEEEGERQAEFPQHFHYNLPYEKPEKLTNSQEAYKDGNPRSHPVQEGLLNPNQLPAKDDPRIMLSSSPHRVLTPNSGNFVGKPHYMSDPLPATSSSSGSTVIRFPDSNPRSDELGNQFGQQQQQPLSEGELEKREKVAKLIERKKEFLQNGNYPPDSKLIKALDQKIQQLMIE